MARGYRRVMNVGELIEALEKYPKDMIVCRMEYSPISFVNIDNFLLDHRDLGIDKDQEVDVVLLK